ncbi:sigma-54 interaction domain-containing protein [Bacillus thermotolerans]|uniref:HTH-type transcriptional regulatory protein TyrR n=1 Tax=Bacillus thermotolerans TaxID=1221996 RepID=A0A0F5HIY2_BACTR|nr:sigma 54-interacting transcriptional regulator [Bacillus thermotolerans]KKB33193.1 sensory box sigma-54 dependent DNA-binding response regulator, in GABA cluster [Bacillus thermotolerans]KKB38617.1 sensory box sigma-54 dependent DNA-binding response regulator, in GABA cluster [Bacillus thermotolerans]KKB41854.1 sensory box sigma-54 dependent DNA-binding response regulator, in GABA cluster [Bacillus thermotolerans]
MNQARDSVYEELFDIFELSFDEILVTNAQGVVIRVNATCRKNYENTAGDLVGKHVKDLEEMGIFYPSATLKVIENLQPVELFQTSGNGRYYHVRTRPVFHEDGSLKSVISYSRDLTEMMQLRNKIEEMEDELATYKKVLKEPLEFDGFVSKSGQMAKVMLLVRKIAKVNSTVLLLGETGVGKSKIVRSIHQLSERREQPLYEINCAALPEQLIESELFGYEGGTFTGAFREGKKGLIELSNNGTLFLDEVGELPLAAQGKLLHVLQEKQIRPVGGRKPISLNLRIIAATNKDLKQMVDRGSFRRDLYYRLNVVPIEVPPLRERKEDIIPLTYHFLDYFNQMHESNVHFSPKVLDAFLQFEWKGNIRELENMVERLVVTSDEIVTLADLPPEMHQQGLGEPQATLPELIEEFERKLIVEAYSEEPSTYKLAEKLGISQSSAARKVRKYVENKE